MPPNRKRKSEAASLPEESSSPKRTAAAPAESPATTGEKRKRGRPRKYAEGTAPTKPSSGRGRGRPRKDPSAVTPSKPTTPKGVGRGRPKKTPNGTTSSTPRDQLKAELIDAKADDNDDDNSGRSYWLMKAEPESRMEKGVDVKFSIDDLQKATKPEAWDGVRNPAARNNIRDMKKGDYAFFYHSNCKIPGIAGTMEIVQEHTPDESAFDPAHPYYDEKSSRDDPKWEAVHVEFRRKFKNLITLNDLKANAKSGGKLENLQMLKQTRLSVSRVSKQEWAFITGLAKGEDSEFDSAEELSKDEGSVEDEAGSSE